MTAQCRPLPACRPRPLQLSPCMAGLPRAAADCINLPSSLPSSCHHLFTLLFSISNTHSSCPGNICAPGGPLCVCSRALHSKASYNCVPAPAACCLCARIPPHIQPPKNSATALAGLCITHPNHLSTFSWSLEASRVLPASAAPPHALLHAHSIPHSSSKIFCQPRPRRHLFMHKQHSIFKLHPQFPVLS